MLLKTIDGITIEVTIDTYAIFRDIVFIDGVIRTTANIEAVFIELSGGGLYEFSGFDRTTGQFSQSVLFRPEDRDSLVRPTLQLKISNQPVVRLEKFTTENLNAQNFWPLVNETLAKLAEKPSGRILEIGSRARSGISRQVTITPRGWNYVGLDFIPGENVDVVGDAHELSTIFPSNTSMRRYLLRSSNT